MCGLRQRPQRSGPSQRIIHMYISAVKLQLIIQFKYRLSERKTGFKGKSPEHLTKQDGPFFWHHQQPLVKYTSIG